MKSPGGKNWATGIMTAIACVSFGVALAAPVFTVLPGAGELTSWLRAFKPESMAPVSQTLLTGISKLAGEGDFLLAGLLAACCVLLPFLKFAVIWSAILGARLECTAIGRFVLATSKYAMTEILILALLILIVKGLPGGSIMRLEPAAYFFIASVVLSIGAVILLPVKNRETAAGRGDLV